MFSPHLPCLALCSMALTLSLSAAPAKPSEPALIPSDKITAGPFKPDDKSLRQYVFPDWFRDAKFGIWSHWGPQAVPRQGDWYARRMYLGPGHIDRKTGKIVEAADPFYKFHVKNYGHPSKFGYKDILPLWKAERWDPDALMALYKKTGAKYFVSMGSHHDNFYLWDSKIHPWNSVKMGPKKDVVGLWQKAAKKEGLRFGISEHLAASYTWYQPNQGSDPTGEFAGVPYDGADPKYADLYHTKAKPGDDKWLTTNTEWHQRWFDVVKELVETYQPDLLYSDSKLPFGNVGQSMLANFYNQNIAQNGGKLSAVYNCKEESEGRWVYDIERGVTNSINEYPWQTDTSIGDWYYRTGQKYMSSGQIVRMLTDIVSKNGNLLINVVQTPEGDLEPDVLTILDEIGAWITIDGEGIYATRPWKVYGEGPSTKTEHQEKGKFDGLKDVPKRPFTQADFRFTTSKDGNTLYAFCMVAPTENLRIESLGKDSKLSQRSIASVELLGGDQPAKWEQKADALVITKPSRLPSTSAIAYKITFQP